MADEGGDEGDEGEVEEEGVVFFEEDDGEVGGEGAFEEV